MYTLMYHPSGTLWVLKVLLCEYGISFLVCLFSLNLPPLIQLHIPSYSHNAFHTFKNHKRTLQMKVVIMVLSVDSVRPVVAVSVLSS